MNSIQAVQELGQSIWMDYIRRGMLVSGEFQKMVEQGISGVTSNPTIFQKAITGSTDYDEALKPFVGSQKKPMEIFESLAIDDIRSATDVLRPVYERKRGTDGFVSLEVDPTLAYDTETTIREARRLFKTIDRPNLMIKVPGTPEGMPAVRQLISEGINVNVTLLFSLDLYARAREAYIAGLEKLAENGGDMSGIASVASFFVSRIDTAVDSELNKKIDQGRQDLKPLLGGTAVASAKLAYQAFKGTFESDRFIAMKSKGARVQRPLWASTSTKNPDYSDVIYVEPLIGPDTVNTLPLDTIDAFMDHGKAETTIEEDIDKAREQMSSIESEGISMERVTDKLLADGVKAFADSFENMLAGIEEKMAKLAGG